jgi:hypothetical protein
LWGQLAALFGFGGSDTPDAPDAGADSSGPDQSLGGGPAPPLEPPPSPGATPSETPPDSQTPGPDSGPDSPSTPDSPTAPDSPSTPDSPASPDPPSSPGGSDTAQGSWGNPPNDAWAGGDPLDPNWEGFKAFVGSIWQSTLGGPVDDGLQVWSNTAGQGMGTAERIYVSAGTGVATLVGVRQLSDAGADHDAVDAHVQSTGERVSKGVQGFVQVLATAVGIKAAFGGAGIPKAPSGASGKTPIWSSTPNKSSVENAFGHWQKHGAEFPEFQNAKQYVEGAQNFVNNPPAGTLTKIRPENGDKLFYNPATNTFGVQGANGAPRTMFRPGGGINYWNTQ